MTNTKILNIPFREYKRPEGASADGGLAIPVPAGEWGNYSSWAAQVRRLGLRFTGELVGPYGLVNLCLEDDFLDYRFELVPNGPELYEKVLEILREFDPEDYRKAARVYTDVEG